MKTRECRSMRLAEFADGELAGADMLRVSRHLEACARCRGEVAALSGLGDLVRAAAAAATPAAPPRLAGLAGGVISRVKAERDQSWRAVLAHGVDDWRWFVVGVGSLSGTFVSVSVLLIALAFGPGPGRQDSLSALLSSRDWQVVRSTPGGSLYLWTTPGHEAGRPEFTRVADQRGAGGAGGFLTEAELLDALGETLTRSGKPIDLESMDAGVRREAGLLVESLKEIQKRRAGSAEVYRIQWVTSTEVTARGL